MFVKGKRCFGRPYPPGQNSYILHDLKFVKINFVNYITRRSVFIINFLGLHDMLGYTMSVIGKHETHQKTLDAIGQHWKHDRKQMISLDDVA